MDFVALRIEVKDDALILTQPCMSEDDQVISIPVHQAEIVLKAIRQQIKSYEKYGDQQ